MLTLMAGLVNFGYNS